MMSFKRRTLNLGIGDIPFFSGTPNHLTHAQICDAGAVGMT
jgi:hypothetical protein